MGVDFLICHYCERTFPDCGPFTRCNEECWLCWCSNKCAEQEGYRRDGKDEEEEYLYSCNFCRKETVEDLDLLAFLIAQSGKTKEQLVKECLES